MATRVYPVLLHFHSFLLIQISKVLSTNRNPVTDFSVRRETLLLAAILLQNSILLWLPKVV
jgi:hypothetical protein